MNEVLGSVGSVIEAALNKGGMKLVTKRLVAFKVEHAAPGKMSVPAIDNHRGFILIGHRQGDSLDVQRVRVNRWVFHPVAVNLRDAQDVAAPSEGRPAYFNGIVRSPSMVVSNRVWAECETPGCFAGPLWMDDVRRRTKQLIEAMFKEQVEKTPTMDANAKQALLADLTKSCQGKMTCKTCSTKESRKLLSVRRRLVNGRLVARPDDPSVDPTYKSLDDPEIDTFRQAAVEHEPLILPRIWAIYRRAKAPMDWVPTDATAEALEGRVSRDGNTIRPYHLATQVNNTGGGLITFLMDVPVGGVLAAGWIDENLLYENHVDGFKRRLMTPVRKYSV